MRERKDISPTGKGRGGQGTVWGSLSGDGPHDWGSEERLGRNLSSENIWGEILSAEGRHPSTTTSQTLSEASDLLIDA